MTPRRDARVRALVTMIATTAALVASDLSARAADGGPTIAADGGAAAGPDGAQAVSIDDAIALYRAHGARRAAAASAIDVTAADLVDARIYPNPTVGLGTTSTVGGSDTIGGTIGQVEVDAPILIGHQRARRGAAAAARVEATRAAIAIGMGDDELAIRRAYVELQAAQARTAALTAAVADVERVRQIVRGRADAGAKSPYDLERTELAVAALTSRLGQARADEQAAAGALAVAIGAPGVRLRAADGFAVTDAVAATEVAADHPRLAAPAADEQAAVAALAAARAEAVPTPALQLGAFATRAPSGVAVTVGVSLPLPLFDRNQGAQARARAEAHQAALEREAARVELGLALASARAVLAQRVADRQAFADGAMARLAKVRTMAEDAYTQGQGGIVELLDAHDAILDAQLRDVDLVAAALAAAIDVRAAAQGR